MPTFTHGKATRLYISDGISAPVVPASGAIAVARIYDVSTYAKDVSFPAKMDTAETSTFGTSTKTYVQGLADRSITFSGSWEGIAAALTDTSAANGVSFDQLMSGLIGAAFPIAYAYGPVGVVAGSVKYYGSGILTDYSVTGSIGSLVEFSAAIQISGAASRGTF